MALDLINEPDRMLWIDRDPEIGCILIGIRDKTQGASLYLSKEETLSLYQGLEIELQIKTILPWKKKES